MGQTLAYLLVSRNLALPGVVVGTLAHLAQLPAVDLSAMSPGPDAAAAMPVEMAREYGAVALQFDGNVLAVAFAEPPTTEDLDALASRIGHRIHPVLADPVVIERYIGAPSSSHPAGSPQSIPPPPPGPGSVPESALVDTSSDADEAAEPSTADRLLQEGMPAAATDGSMPLHIDDLLRYAVSVGASDLHLTAGMPASIRLHGAMRHIEGCPPLDNEVLLRHGVRHPSGIST